MKRKDIRMAENGIEPYEVNIPLFEGPLDLLLHLVTKNRIDIHDIPIHLITDQYLAYLEKAREFNLELGSSFFAMASTLLLIKSRMLLPKKRQEEADDSEDPRQELSRSLEEFKKMKEICPTDELGNETYAASLWPDWDGNMVMYVKAMATAYYGYDELGFGLYNPTNGEFYDALDENGPYIEMLRFFNQLYRAGLLDPNSMTQTYDEMSQKVKNGGVFWGIFNYASSMVYNTDKHLGEGKMMYARVPDEANPIVYGLSTLGGNRIWSVGSKAAYPELCLAILDFFATPEGSMTMWYGPRGLMWDYDENGGMYFTELGDICNKDTKHDLNGVVWTSPYTGKQYTLSGNFNDGCIQANNTTYSKDAINPDGKLGETFNRDTWVSILNAVSYPIQEDWRNWSGAVLADPYFESIGKYTIMPDLPYSESVKDDELKVKWEQCAKSIKNNSWLAIYAKADGEFNMHIRNMITQCNNYGYADCLEWSKGEAATKWRLTQELNAVGQE